MRTAMVLLAVAVGVALAAGSAFAADEKPVSVTMTGTVVKVDGKTLVLKMKAGEKEREANITTDEKTAVTLDGKEAKLADLKEGMPAVVTLAEVKPGASVVAAKIDAKSKS